MESKANRWFSSLLSGVGSTEKNSEQALYQPPSLHTENTRRRQAISPLTCRWRRCLLFLRPSGNPNEFLFGKKGKPTARVTVVFIVILGCLLCQGIWDDQMGEWAVYQWPMLEPPSVHTGHVDCKYNEAEQCNHQPQAGLWLSRSGRYFCCFVCYSRPTLAGGEASEQRKGRGEKQKSDCATHPSFSGQSRQSCGLCLGWRSVGGEKRSESNGIL